MAPAALTPQWWQDKLGALLSDDLMSMGLHLLLGVLLFLAGWLVAKLVSWAVFRLLCNTDLDNKLANKLGLKLLLEDDDTKRDPNALERGVAQTVFYLVMALVVVGVLDFAGLEQAAGPIQGLVDTVMQALPLIGKAVLIMAVATIAGLILRKVVTKALDLARVDRRFAALDAPEPTDDKAEAKPDEDVAKPFSQTAGQVVFSLVMIIGLAGAFDALQIEAISVPLSNAINTLLALLPAIGIAILIAAGGWVLGKIVRTVATRALESLGFDKLVAKARLDGLFGSSSPSKVVGWLAMAFIVVQAAIAALDRIGLQTLSAPMTDMMAQFWALLPAVLITTLIVIFGVFAGRLLRGIVQKALEGVGFDKLMDKLGFGRIAEREDDLAKPSGLVGFVVQGAVVLLAIVQGLNNLGLDLWAGYVDAFLVFSVTRAAVALLIVGVGFTVGNYVRDVIEARQRGEQPAGDAQAGEALGPVWMAEFARYVVLVFAFTMGIHQLGVAEDFVLLSFALLFGALCLAGALAFGLGSRELAGEIVRERYRKAKLDNTGPKGPGAGLFGK
ncbi:Small-conductance mechanosensitive channel [Enhygromyxa salina]|uniref:Small-conductance mechanosensitive channel n=1 Tax=Enhygromyxa salina TaxID=215803 RepID=A0A0C1ZD17_9BACT|nr:Small-conductance mechanosensitive channel [Enhygromyxa salina]